MNPAIASQYFVGVGTSDVLSVLVNPAILAKVVEDEALWSVCL